MFLPCYHADLILSIFLPAIYIHIVYFFGLVSLCMSAVNNTTLRLGKSNFAFLVYFLYIGIIKIMFRGMVGLLANNDLQSVWNHRRSFGGVKGRGK
jgi:hypothetical protein